MAENCPNKRKKIVIVVQGAERVPSKINPRRNTLRHIVIKLTNTKENFFFLYSNRGKATDNLQGNSRKDIR